MLRVLITVLSFNFQFFILFGQNVEADILPINEPAPKIKISPYIFNDTSQLANVIYFRDERIDRLFEIQKNNNKRRDGISGYKVQLFRGNSQKLSKQRAFEIEAMVYKKFGNETDVDVIFNTPYWRVQVGNFRLQNQAMKEEARYKSNFPEIADDISVIPAIIDFPELKGKIIQ